MERDPATGGSDVIRERRVLLPPPQPRSTLRRRRAFAITETELKLIAAAAIIGLRRIPKTG
jgi:hypothetical protein